MSEHHRWRTRARRALEGYFRRRSLPRLLLTVVVLLTGLGGFAIDVGLLHANVRQMWVRYPLAVLGAYGLFLLLMRLWVELERRRFRPEEITLGEPSDGDGEDEETRRTSEQSTGTSWLEWLDLGSPLDLADDAEGCLVVAVLLAALGLIVAAISTALTTLFAAPALIAEVFLDAFLAAALYRRLKIAEQEHWLGTAVRKTWRAMAMTAAALAAIGGVLAYYAPDAPTLTTALRQIWPDSR